MEVPGKIIGDLQAKNLRLYNGGLAQLARAPDLHSGGQGFDSLILHGKAKKLLVFSYEQERRKGRQRSYWLFAFSKKSSKEIERKRYTKIKGENTGSIPVVSAHESRAAQGKKLRAQSLTKVL